MVKLEQKDIDEAARLLLASFQVARGGIHVTVTTGGTQLSFGSMQHGGTTSERSCTWFSFKITYGGTYYDVEAVADAMVEKLSFVMRTKAAARRVVTNTSPWGMITEPPAHCAY